VIAKVLIFGKKTGEFYFKQVENVDKFDLFRKKSLSLHRIKPSRLIFTPYTLS